ncbi:MAG: hypothetical protein ACREA0_03195 [bacterium]
MVADNAAPAAHDPQSLKVGRKLSPIAAVVYLDQCAISRFVPPVNAGWSPVFNVLSLGLARQRMLCPHSLEHLMESAAMPPEKAATTDELLRRLSGGWSFRVEPQLIAAQIASFVREVPLGLSDIMVQHPFKPLSDPGVRDFLAGSKADLDSFNESKFRFTNQINAVIRDGPRGTWSVFIRMMGEIARGYAAAMKREVTAALAQGAVTVAGRSDAPNVPMWTSSVLYLLFSLHRFTRSELVLLEACLDRPVGLLFVPFFQIKATLEAYQSWKRQKLEAADQYDVTRVACALPFVDVLVTDGGMASALRDTHMDRFFRTEVFSTKQRDRPALLKWLQNAVS